MNIVDSKKLICRPLPALRDNRAWALMPEKKSPKVHYKTIVVVPTSALDWLSGSGCVATEVPPRERWHPAQDRQERSHDRRPKRIRCKEHLRFVASQPCLICGRVPSHAHHVRYAQSRGLSLKVSDEFTVPLCAIHHHHIHTTGKEREWWQERNIDPLKIANALWQQSHERSAPRRELMHWKTIALGDREAEPVHQASPERIRATAVANLPALPGGANKRWCSTSAEGRLLRAS